MWLAWSIRPQAFGKFDERGGDDVVGIPSPAFTSSTYIYIGSAFAGPMAQHSLEETR